MRLEVSAAFEVREFLKKSRVQNECEFFDEARNSLAHFAASGCDLRFLVDYTAEYRALLLVESGQTKHRQKWDQRFRNLAPSERAFVDQWAGHHREFLENDRQLGTRVKGFQRRLEALVRDFAALAKATSEYEVQDDLFWGQLPETIVPLLQQWVVVFQRFWPKGLRNEIKSLEQCLIRCLVDHIVKKCGTPCWNELAQLICAWDHVAQPAKIRRLTLTPDSLRMSYRRAVQSIQNRDARRDSVQRPYAG
jgi:hypothetical protein